MVLLVCLLVVYKVDKIKLKNFCDGYVIGLKQTGLNFVVLKVTGLNILALIV